MDGNAILVTVILLVLFILLIRWQDRHSGAPSKIETNAQKAVRIRRREIGPPPVSKALIHRLLYAESDEQFQQTLTEHPELEPFNRVGVPMHEALGLLLMARQVSGEPDPGEQIVMISEVKPGISSVMTQTSKGERIASLYEIPADTLTEMMLVSPKDLEVYLPRVLQTALHHPELLTNESYWMLGEMAAAETTPIALRPELNRLHRAVGLCLEYGLDEDWINDLCAKMRPEG